MEHESGLLRGHDKFESAVSNFNPEFTKVNGESENRDWGNWGEARLKDNGQTTQPPMKSNPFFSELPPPGEHVTGKEP